MEKFRELMKVTLACVLSIGLFSAAFAGFNHLTFAAARAAVTGGALVPIPDVVQNSPLGVTVLENGGTYEAGRGETLPYNEEQEFIVPDLKVVASEGLNLHPNNIVSAAAMPMEEAAQIGARYIKDVFGECIGGMYVEMLFAAWPSQSRTYWIGIVFPVLIELDENSTVEARIARANTELYRFIIDAVTGLRVDVSPGFGYIPQLTYEESRAVSEFRMSEARLEQIIAWQDMNADERLAYLGLSEESIEPYLETAREFARRHFNNSELDYETESFNVWSHIDRTSTSYGIEFGGIELIISDSTGREAIITVDAINRNLRPGLGIRTQHNDFIPGFSYDRPGGRG